MPIPELPMNACLNHNHADNSFCNSCSRFRALSRQDTSLRHFNSDFHQIIKEVFSTSCTRPSPRLGGLGRRYPACTGS
jgi:hypothetical protein